MEERKIGEALPDPAMFISAFRASPIGIALEDLEGRPLFANPALCSMLGFSEEEMRKKHCVEFSPPEDAQKDWALFEQLRAGSIDHYHLEKRFFRRDGSVIWGRLSISLAGSGASRLVVAMVEDLSEKQVSPPEPAHFEAGLEKLTRHLILAQEEERIQICRELHRYIDDLTILAISLGRGQNPPASLTKAWQTIEDARQQIDNMVTAAWALSNSLHSSILEHVGLAAAAASLCREVSEKQNVKIDFYSEGIPKNLPKEISLCLYRILQEAVQQTAAKGGSPAFKVSLTGKSAEIGLEVQGWGQGFGSGQGNKASLSLASMRERLKLVDGDLSFTAEHQRSTIHARVPIPSQESDENVGRLDA